MSISREQSEDGKFVLPRDIISRAKKATKAGEMVLITPLELTRLLQEMDAALNGDSNDEEHDALYEAREKLSEVLEDAKRRMITGGDLGFGKEAWS